MTPLLVLVDLQRDYLASPGLEPSAEEVVRRAEALLRGCRELRVPVVHVWTTVSRGDDRRMPHWKREDRWLCEEGTPGHAPPPGLEPGPDEAVVHKASFSPFPGGELDRMLQGDSVDHLVVAGVHLHGCIRQTVLGVYERHGLESWVVEDATASNDPVHAAITRRYLERRAARFLTVPEVIEGLRGAGQPSTREAAADQVHEVAERCRAAHRGWQAVGPAERAEPLNGLATLLEQQAEPLARAMAIEIGKPVRYGSVEVRRTAEMLRGVAEQASAALDPQATARAEVRRRPLGVVAVVTPWNSPVYIPLGKIGPALAYGNSVLWKPAPAADAISKRVEALFHDAGLPTGVLSLVSGGRRTAEAAMANPSVDAVSLTGSSLAGFSAQEICARRRLPLQAELGGNNAAVVWPDADLEHAARQIAEGAFALAGQRCTANRRVIVHAGCRSEFLELLQRETAALTWGDPLRSETQVGPLVGTQARDRVAALIGRAERTAGPLMVPHDCAAPSADGGNAPWLPPTIICCEDSAHELVQHEAFGPVLVVQTARDWDETIALVNGVSQGLAAAVFTSSADVAARFLADAAVGILKVNRSTADAEVGVPFGGWGSSGIGPPEHGSFDREFYTRPQAVYR